ncbi:MAG: DUF6457 domain-containing protein [Propionibacteriaceae bacterium]|jgi:hypothetical protein|nr:DUF6457 domain-containing protein [Propionibacteriaceae bacterium]
MGEFDVVEDWLAYLRGVLDLEGLEAVDVGHLLGAVRAIAHGVTHPAGPVAAFAAGYAAARSGGGSIAVTAAIDTAAAAAESFAGSHD